MCPGSDEDGGASVSSGSEAAEAEVRDHSSDGSLKILSVNVTVLTRARLETVLKLALKQGVHAICFQETRHPRGGFGWADEDLRNAGYRCQWSAEPPPDKAGRTGFGGTALAWLPSLGRGEAVESASHRQCGRVFGDFALWSVYGPASRASPHWLGGILEETDAVAGKPRLAIGDFNWRKQYSDFVVEPWSEFETETSTVRAGTAKPTRCLSAGVDVEDGVCSLLCGVPHHRAVTYTVGFKTEAVVDKKWRLRRTGKYAWSIAPLVDEKDALVLAGDRVAPRAQKQTPLGTAWKSWHGRAEAVLKKAVELELAVATTRPERPKGSEASMRPVAPTAPHRANESILSRRLRRLHRKAVAESGVKGQQGHAQLGKKDRWHWKVLLEERLCRSLRAIPSTWAEAESLASTLYSEERERQQKTSARAWKQQFSTWALSTLRAGTKILRKPTPAATFTASDKRAE